jgi:acetolactate synthase I/II/III large subunit
MTDLASGHLAVGALAKAGVEHLFTLSGGHIFPLYEGCRDHGVRIVDTRHEQAAAFAAEGLAKLTRRPQVAALTAGPGVTNGVSAVATARFGGSPLVVLGGRAPHGTWGRGGLQEIDHVAFMAPLTKHATTAAVPEEVPSEVVRALELAATPGRGPTFVDIPMDTIFTPADDVVIPAWDRARCPEVVDDALARAARRLAEARSPVIVAGTDVCSPGPSTSFARWSRPALSPRSPTGWVAGRCPPITSWPTPGPARPRSRSADLVLVIGTPLDFRLGFGAFGEAEVVHVVETPDQVDQHAMPAEGLTGHLPRRAAGPGRGRWGAHRRARPGASRPGRIASARWSPPSGPSRRTLLASDADQIHPAASTASSVACSIVTRWSSVTGATSSPTPASTSTPTRPGRGWTPAPTGAWAPVWGTRWPRGWLTPTVRSSPCSATAQPASGLMDVETLVRQQLPVVMIVGNNGIWALEKYPMQQIYDGWDVAADLQPALAYDQVVTALGGAGETVSAPGELAGALDRAFAAGVPYLINVLTDPGVAYPRSTALA